MSNETQKLNFVPEPTTFEDTHIEIKKGKMKPSIEKTSFSNDIRVDTIQIFISSNYVPGKISFKVVEEK